MRSIPRLMTLGAILVATVPVAFTAPAKLKTVSVRGEVIDLYCYLDEGGRGAKHKDCAVACAKAGNPIALVDKNGKVYLLLGSDNHNPNRDALIAKMAETVTVTGKLVKRGGSEAIEVSKVK